MPKVKKPRSFNEMARTVRGDWNGINPVTKIERDRSKYTRKDKHKNRKFDFQ